MTASSRAALRGSGALGMGAVIGGNGSGDVVSATRVDGHSSGVPWLCQGRAGQARAQTSPRQEIGSCETGLSWGMLWIVEINEFPGPRPDVHGPPSPAGFGISRVLGSAAPQSARRNRHRVSLRACQTESRRSKGQVNRALGDDALCGFLSWCPSNNVHLSMQIVFPPHSLPANIRSRSEQRPNGIWSASRHRSNSVRSASRH